MRRATKALAMFTLVLLASCEGSTDPEVVSLTGTWTGKFSNGISITIPLVHTGTALIGTFDTGDTQGAVTGTYTESAFTLVLTKTSASGTQRNLTSPVLSADRTRVTANWNDGGGGLTGTFCLAAPASTPCP